MTTKPNGELVPLGGGDPVPLIRELLTIGRRESCDVCLRFGNISSLHCELNFKEGYWYIRDRDSTNGIKVNGVRVSKKLLLPEDEVDVATRQFTIRYTAPVGKPPIDEVEDDIMSQSLLERAGLERPRNRDDERKRR